MMGDIARLSGGRFHYVERSDAVARVFEREVLRLERTLARNAVVTITPGPGVRVDSVVGQEVQSGEDGVNVLIGDIAEGETRDIIVRLTAGGRGGNAAVEGMTVRMAFDDAVTGAGRLERDVYLGARALIGDEAAAAGRNADVERAAARMTAAAVTVEAIRLARGGELDRARQTLDSAIYEAQARADAERNREYAADAESMRVRAGALPSIHTPPPAPSTAPSGGVGVDFDGEAPASVIREAHDRAMETLQGSVE